MYALYKVKQLETTYDQAYTIFHDITTKLVKLYLLKITPYTV